METKYTEEFIEQQRKYINVYDGNVCWFDGNNIVYVKDYDPDKDEFQYGKFGEVGSPEEAEAVANALIDYPDALDEIERLQVQVERLREKRKIRRMRATASKHTLFTRKRLKRAL